MTLVLTLKAQPPQRLDLSPLVVLLIIWCLQIAIGRLALWWVGAGAL